MARQIMSKKNTAKLSKELDLDINWVSVRGGTNHTKVLYLNNKNILSLFKDGSLEKWDRNWNN